jgi:hypothetical protein
MFSYSLGGRVAAFDGEGAAARHLHGPLACTAVRAGVLAGHGQVRRRQTTRLWVGIGGRSLEAPHNLRHDTLGARRHVLGCFCRAQRPVFGRRLSAFPFGRHL